MTNDPRKVHGEGMIGPGGPRDRDGVLVDATNGVLMDSLSVAMVEPRRVTDTGVEIGEPIVMLVLGGRINRTSERAEITFVLDPIDGAAAVISELLGVAHRWGGDDFLARLKERIDEAMEAGRE